jgi:hypothetical protein
MDVTAAISYLGTKGHPPGAAAAAIDADEGPSQSSLASSEITEE